ncbi:MAG: hypothetical protein K0R44_4 [Thermomicrobiales bacterium]|jgi:hypothetical protein|nr:hypothetical protein [Thermomicrobiales bacterium]MDF3014779.1 hypothetical protein [Thermomicrobiales bacterium]
MDEEIYNEATAEFYCAIALQTGRCAELLNGLANGGAVTLDVSTTPPGFAFISAEQVAQLAEGL